MAKLHEKKRKKNSLIIIRLQVPTCRVRSSDMLSISEVEEKEHRSLIVYPAKNTAEKCDCFHLTLFTLFLLDI